MKLIDQDRSPHRQGTRQKVPRVVPVFGGVFGVLASAVVRSAAAIVDDVAPAIPTRPAPGDASFSLSGAPASVAPAEESPALSLAAYPRAGWQATLSTRAHGVRGTVTIVDADTFRVDNFFYDGGGINVHFILAATDNNTAFRDARLVTDLNLLGTAHAGDSITIDLPTGTTFDGYNAVSLWCLPAAANFGSGTFINVLPEPSTPIIFAIGTLTLGYFARRRIR